MVAATSVAIMSVLEPDGTGNVSFLSNIKESPNDCGRHQESDPSVKTITFWACQHLEAV
jgi:hypothetical protein